MLSSVVSKSLTRPEAGLAPPAISVRLSILTAPLTTAISGLAFPRIFRTGLVRAGADAPDKRSRFNLSIGSAPAT